MQKQEKLTNMNILKPFIKLTGDIYLSKYPCFCLYKPKFHKLKGDEIRIILNTIKPGDILFRRYHGYLNTILTPGYWGHAALYIGRNKVIHALGKGITKEDILDFCRCDDFALSRIKNVTHNSIKDAIEKANETEKEKVQYDYEFERDNNNLYCTELIDNVYNKLFEKDYEKKWGKEVLLPDGLYNSTKLNKILVFKHK